MITNLYSQLNVAKTELEKCCADKAFMNEKAKEKHIDEVFELKTQIQALSKNSKVKDKTIYDLSKILDNANKESKI